MSRQNEGEVVTIARRLVTVAEGSRLTGIDPAELFQACRRIGIPTTKIGRQTVVLRSDLPVIAGDVAERRANAPVA